MTDEELARLLADTLIDVPHGDKTNAYVLFGIRYANELRGRTNRITDMARHGWPEARVSPSAKTDIGYGMRLSRYVNINQPAPFWLA